MLPAPFLLLLAAPLLASPSLPARLQQPEPVHAVSPWGADYFPDVTLTTHQGKAVRFFEDLIRDRVVVINFIYTSCPDACPLETARLAEVQDVLGERVGRDVFFYSISIDPERDTVTALANYAERFQVKPGWLFLRGSEEDVLLLRRKLGVLGQDETELKDHSLSVVIGNQATGRWMRRSPFENAHVLAEEIGTWLHNWKATPISDEDYSTAPRLRSLSRGESLFRTRCSACHVVGSGDGLARVGPNLQGVTRWRERAWLERWIAEPDRVLAEGDELALALFEAYRRVPMPNMRLNALEVAALIEYIEEETERTLAAPGGSAAAPETPKSCCLKRESLVLSSSAGESGTPLAEGVRAPKRLSLSIVGALLLLPITLAAVALLRTRKRRRSAGTAPSAPSSALVAGRPDGPARLAAPS